MYIVYILTHVLLFCSRTGSKLGISPLMLAAMNGHTSTVKLLLDMGSDINAQVRTSTKQISERNKFTFILLFCVIRLKPIATLLSLWPAFKDAMRWSTCWWRDRPMLNTGQRYIHIVHVHTVDIPL